MADEGRRKKGKVWLVGAGPGDAGLLTLKGREVLGQAQVVVYDHLIGDGVLCLIPESAEKIDAGKEAGDHPVSQGEINRILLEKALEGKRVVRLKGGDPFLFGRGGEELEVLADAGVEFEVVPGVPSATAVPAYCGIPVTHRDFSSSVHIVTGHRKTDGAAEIDYEALVRAGGTLVFLMGVKTLPEICRNLIRAGMPGDRPAALLQQGTTAGQKRILASLQTLPEEALRQRAEPPAVIVVGKVCALASDLSWREKLPLSGRKILVTRPREMMPSLAGKLRELGAEVLEVPAVRICPVQGKRAGRVREEIRRISGFDWIAFTSPSGVRVFFDVFLRGEKKDLRDLAGCRIAALGSGTSRELEKRGLYPDLVPAVHDSRSLGRCLAQACGEGERILIPRSSAGSPDLIEELEKGGDLSVVDLPLYDARPESGGAVDLEGKFRSGSIDCAVFTSASGVRAFAESVPGLDLSGVKAACIGRKTREAAEKLGMESAAAEDASEKALVQLIREWRG